MKRLSLVVCSVALLVGCGGEDPGAGAADGIEQAVIDEVEARTGAEPSTSTQPCDILDDELVRAHFNVAEGVEITRSPSKYSPHPLCTVTWDKPNADEIREQNREQIMERMRAQMEGGELPAQARATNELTLTIYEPRFESPEAALGSFETAMRRLSEGVTARSGDREVTFQADVEPVEGIGLKAMWAPKLRQLSVVEGRNLFHVTVNTGELATDKELARSVAADVVSKL